MDPELNLEKAVNATRQSELVKKQQSIVRGSESQTVSTKNVEAVHKGNHRKGKVPKQSSNKTAGGAKNPTQSAACNRCGKSPAHSRSQCPAKDSTCHKCKKKGHYQTVCRSGKADGVNALEESEPFLGVVSFQEVNNIAEDSWRVPIIVNGTKVVFKIDTGADVTVLPESEFKRMETTLQTSSKILTGPAKGILKVCGTFLGKLETDKSETEQEIYVVKGR